MSFSGEILTVFELVGFISRPSPSSATGFSLSYLRKAWI
jgi:hypothetical protein